MFKYVLLFAFVAYVSAAGSIAEVKSQELVVGPFGFEANLLLDNGASSSSSGDAKGNIQGSYAWVSPEGTKVEISYVADENGYQPSGELLPTPPPIPAEILKEIEYLASHPQKEGKN